MAESRPSPAVKGMKRGVWIILIALILSLFAGVITALDEDFGVLFIFPLLCLLIGFGRLLYGAFIEERRHRAKALKADPITQGQIGTAPRVAKLSLPVGTPVASFEQPKRNTRDMAQPPSVTENTTRLLEDDAKDGR